VQALRSGHGARGLKATVSAEREFTVDLASPISLALELDFDPARPQPRHFGAPAATSRPYAVPGFSGSVTTGASCNCNVMTVIPHCNGTHTECVGHLTNEPCDAYRVVPAGLIEALLLTVAPVTAAGEPGESTEPAPCASDLLVTRRALESAWARFAGGANTNSRPLALVVRTGHDGLPSAHSAAADAPAGRDSAGPPPPYLTREAARLLVDKGIQHLIIDLPSIDREHDEGRLTAHRIFFGLPAGSRELARATRGQTTVTELATIPADVADGPYLLAIQVPAWRGDAVPSRPLLYPLQQ
jgi:putative cyclase